MHSHQFSACIQKSFIRWFDANKRFMPWRETSDPYKIWISEIMLQQTQVATVENYYKRFINTFPDIKTLAGADIHEVMKQWEGLGYYSRARNLHRTAKIVVDKHQAVFPDQLEELLTLPGIGRYTAGAILSIAFGKRAPVLDGNVIRVLTRVFHITDNINQAATQKELWDFAESIMPDSQTRAFNEALMELGATVCIRKNPHCNHCPLMALCEARKLQIQNDLPVKTPKKPVPYYDVVAALIWHNDKFLITLRPADGLLGNLWEFPGGKVKLNESHKSALLREIKEELQLSIKVNELLASVKHAYTHFKITLHVYHCHYLKGEIHLDRHAAQNYKWITPSQLDDYAFPGANRKIINLLKWT